MGETHHTETFKSDYTNNGDTTPGSTIQIINMDSDDQNYEQYGPYDQADDNSES